MAEIYGEIAPRKSINGTVELAKTVYENDYELLKNLPTVEGVVIIGDISLEDLGLVFDDVTIIKDGGVWRVRNNSHGHVIDNIEGLRGIIEGKAEASDLVTLGNNLETHKADLENPHKVTAEQIGLGNVENLAVNDLAPTYSDVSELAPLSGGETLSAAFAKIKLAVSRLIAHFADRGNPHGVTKAQVGLGDVENKSSAAIRGELTKENVTSALGYTPPTVNTTYGAATASANGLMSSGDKSKLNGIAAGANKYVHPAYTAKSSGLYKITVDETGHVSAVTAVTKADITALGIPAQDTNTTYGAATASANGLMSSGDKSKLDGIAAGAQVNSITGVKGNSETAYRTGQVNLTAANIGAAASGHTHNYAGSSSAGGAATSSLACTGNSATATKATQDSAGQQINATYIKALSVSGTTITYTKGNGTTGTINVDSGISTSSIIAQATPMEDYFKAF